MYFALQEAASFSSWDFCFLPRPSSPSWTSPPHPPRPLLALSYALPAQLHREPGTAKKTPLSLAVEVWLTLEREKRPNSLAQWSSLVSWARVRNFLTQSSVYRCSPLERQLPNLVVPVDPSPPGSSSILAESVAVSSPVVLPTGRRNF